MISSYFLNYKLQKALLCNVILARVKYFWNCWAVWCWSDSLRTKWTL